MKSIWREILMAIAMGFILPGIVANWAVEEPETVPRETVSVPEIPETRPPVRLDMLLRRKDGTAAQQDMDEYLVGVVLAEMPVSFHEQAKMAQAVVARTFALKAYRTGGKHGDGSVCTDSGCCQAYISESQFLARGGSREDVDNARAAVYATSGYVLTYEGKLIEATYFSCSGGSTEDAVAVWGTDFPYLRATDSPGEEYAVHYTDTMEFTRQELEAALGIDLTGSPGSWIGTATYTSGDGVNTLVIGGKEWKGTELRSKLGLRSTAFTWEAKEDTIVFTTLGFGHRVGLSQYGADAMAMGGSTWQEILAHYYQGTTLELTNSGA